MKFTRTLALAAAATLALTMTACDTTDSTNPPVEAVTFNLGNQKSAATSASAFSARDMKQVSLTELGENEAKWARIDVVILTEYANATANGDSLTFYSPYEVSTKTAVFPTTAGKITAAKAAGIRTQFARLNITQDEFTALKNADDVEELTDAVTTWSNSISVKKDHRIALKLTDGSFAIANIVAASGAYSIDATAQPFGYNVQVRLAK